MVEYCEKKRAVDELTKIACQLPDRRSRIVARCINAVEQLPSSPPVVPVRHGKWLDVQETDLYVPDHKFTMTKTAETCSECKVRIGFVGAKLYLFDGICPNCGARMDGGADNGE